MSNPANLSYTKTHEWCEKLDNGNMRIGLTDYAQNSLGDIVFVGLPEVGDAVTADASFGDVESVKAVSEMISPVSGTVTAVNDALQDAPESINEDPYGAWILEASDITATTELLDAAAYEAFCASEQ